MTDPLSAGLARTPLVDGAALVTAPWLRWLAQLVTGSSGFTLARTAVADRDYTVQPTDVLVAFTALTAPRTLTLPTAVGRAGMALVLKDESGQAGTHHVLVQPVGGQMIENALTMSLTMGYEMLAIYSTGAGWAIW
jgi:hypothetical protein